MIYKDQLFKLMLIYKIMPGLALRKNTRSTRIEDVQVVLDASYNVWTDQSQLLTMTINLMISDTRHLPRLHPQDHLLNEMRNIWVEPWETFPLENGVCWIKSFVTALNLNQTLTSVSTIHLISSTTEIYFNMFYIISSWRVATGWSVLLDVQREFTGRITIIKVTTF